MAKRIVKSLNKTGRVSRTKASTTAVSLREAYSRKKPAKNKKITKKTTATGRSKIAFHVKNLSKKPAKKMSRRRA